MRTIKLLIVLLFTYPAAVSAQDFTPIRSEIDRLAALDIAGLRESDDFEDLKESLIGDLSASVVRVKLLDNIESLGQQIVAFRRADIQTGSSSGASGSTSAVLSPLLPAIFGVSFENGAITRSVSGSTIVLKANPAGLFCASGQDSREVALRDGDACRTFWKRIGITAAFDTSRGEKKKALEDLQTLDNQLSEFTVRFELVNHRTLDREKFARVFASKIDDWRRDAREFADMSARAAAGSYESGLREAVEAGLSDLIATSSYVSASTTRRARQIEDIIRSALKDAQGDPANVNARRRLWRDSLKSDEKLQSAVINALVVTAEYGYQKPDLATEAIGDIVPSGVRPPGLHSVRLIAAKGIGDKKLDVTANASASFFAETRPGMHSAFRDFRAGIEGKFRMRDINNWGSPALSFAGLYVYLHQEPLGLGIPAFNEAETREKGHIGLFQAKFEMPTASNAIRIPLSFTYSNRTELIEESSARGQIGISFNLDSLFDR